MEPRDRTPNDPSDAADVGRARRRVIVSGRVQGVFFRDTCRRVAQRLGLGGWVRNRSDGAVEAVFEGDADDVDEAVEWCRHGPTQAIVADVQITDEPVVGEAPFRIVR